MGKIKFSIEKCLLFFLFRFFFTRFVSLITIRMQNRVGDEQCDRVEN